MAKVNFLHREMETTNTRRRAQFGENSRPGLISIGRLTPSIVVTSQQSTPVSVLHFTALFCVVLHFTTLYLLFCTVLICSLLPYTVMRFTVLYWAVLFCVELHFTLLCSTAVL